MSPVGRTPACPRCGSADTIPIAYGFPGPEMMEEAERGEIALGGCCIEEYQPEWHCRACRNDFPQLDASDWYFPLDADDWTDDDFDAWERAEIAEEADRVRLVEVIAEADAAGVDRTDAGIEAFAPERRRAYLLDAIRRQREMP